MVNLDFVKKVVSDFLSKDFPDIPQYWDLVILSIRGRPIVRFYKKDAGNRRENFVQLWLRKKFDTEEKIIEEIKDFLIKVNTITISEIKELKMLKESIEKAIDYSIDYSIKEFKIAFQVEKEIKFVAIKDYVITLTISIFGSKNKLEAILTSKGLKVKYNFEYLNNKECMDYLEFLTFLIVTFNEEFEKLRKKEILY